MHFLKSAVVPLCSLISLMLLLYFGGTYYTYKESLIEMRERAKSTVSEITRSEANSLNQKLEEVSRNTAYLQTVTERLFQYNYDPKMSHDKVKLQQAEDGFFYRDLDTMMDGATIYSSSLPSSLYVALETKLTESLIHRLHVTEALDLHFQRTVDSNTNIHSVYFTSWDQSNRTYPPIESMPNFYRADRQATFFKDYGLADGKNNPDRKMVWTAAYWDEKEESWMLSSVAPIYRYGFLEGVIGINIVLNNFTANLTSTPLIWNSKPIITDENSNVLDQSAKARKLLDVAASSGNAITSNSVASFKKENLFQHAIFNNTDINLESYVNGFSQTSCCADIDGEDYLLSQQIVNETGWRLVMLTPMSKVIQQFAQYQSFINNLGIYFVLLTGLFFILFFIYLKKQASHLARRVSKPIEMVTEFISRLNRLGDNQGDNKPLPAMQVGIRELDRLIDSSTEIQRARLYLSQMNEELEQKNHQLEILATTDRLTGLLNRHKLDQIIEYELRRARRYEAHFSLALIDIDHFKQVNDTYGHQVGDSILAGISSIMKRRVRSSDIVGRWGGEEFIILLPNTPLQQATIVLDELREQLSRSNFEPVKSVTISIGLAHSSTYSCEDDILTAADNALYHAKNNGRNRIKTAPEQQSSPEALNEMAEIC